MGTAARNALVAGRASREHFGSEHVLGRRRARTTDVPFVPWEGISWGGSTDIEEITEEEEEEEEDAEEENTEEVEEEDEEEEKGSPQTTNAFTSTAPVSMRVRSPPIFFPGGSGGVGAPPSSLVSHSTTTNYSRTRTILSLRQNVARTWPGRPPLSTVVIRLGVGGRVLDDAETVGSLLPEDDDDEDEDEDEDEDDLPALTLVIDAVPSVDPKFAVEYAPKPVKKGTGSTEGGPGVSGWLAGATTRELYAAYVSNEAALMQLGQELCNDKHDIRELDESDEDNDDDFEEEETSNPRRRHLTPTQSMQAMASELDDAIRSGLPLDTVRKHGLDGGEVQEGETGEDQREAAEAQRQARIRRRAVTTVATGGIGIAARTGGGAQTGVKRVLQKNLNINWFETTRNALLFLFFAIFGGRTQKSRALLFTGAPLVFLLQCRPAKIILKQLYYAIGKPPGIVLSLLPAPHQAIMGLDLEGAMSFLYSKGRKNARKDGGEDANHMKEDTEDEDEDEEVGTEDSYDDSEEGETEYDDSSD